MRKMHKNLVDLNFDDLKKCLPEQLQKQSVTAVLLALGSNYQADTHLPRVRESLAMLGQIQLSTAFQNPDFTASLEQPKPDYTNQCVYIALTPAMTLQQLQQIFKQYERECHRRRSTEKQTPVKKVTMDIDILLIQTALNKNSLSDKQTSKPSRQWIIMADRYPFKAHETAGVKELIADASSTVAP